MKIKWQLPALIVSMGLVAMGLQSGCEGTSGPDTNGVDSYFADHPYVSDPRNPTSPSDLTVTPSSATVSYVGQVITFTVKGGTPAYHWDVVNGNGRIRSADGDGSQGIYNADVVGANSVVVFDASGHSAIAAVTIFTASSLTISPTSATATNNTQRIVFTASGGTPPYTWDTGDHSRGIVETTTGSSVSYKRISAGDNSVNVHDTGTGSASAVVSQP
ncbi:MAG: hypothetical protein EPN23_03060 [Verrucomicrobia bacterium]|nr:MAG: hypothetical protein EPN23_03060 [Verrucomicrobiota bacterium]